MSNNYSNLNRNDANEGEESFNDEQQEAAEGGAAPPVPTANPMHLLSLASNFAAQGQTNPTTQQSELFRQLQTFLQQGGQNAPAPAIQQPQSPATQLQGSTQTMPIQQQPPAAAPPPSQDAVPMLVNAMLRGGQFPSTASTSNVELNQTLILAMTQLVQYRNLAQFLMQLLSQMIGPLPVQMLVASMGVLASPLSPATSPNTNPQQLPAEGIPALATLSQQIAQNLSQQNEAGSDSNEAQAILSQFQNFLQRMAAGNVSTSGSESGFQLPNPAMAFFSSTTPSTGNNASEASGMESANSRRNPNLSSPDTNRDRPAAAATEPPIPLPVRKKRKYDHEAFPEKLHRLIRDAEANDNAAIVKFTEDGSKFQLLDAEAFEEHILPQYFRHNRMSSFKRLLRMYNFSRVTGTWMEGTFEHPLFHRDHPDWCKQMQRQE